MQNKYLYKFLPRAEADFWKALDYIEFELNNPKAAEDLAKEFDATVKLICEFPNIGKEIDNEFVADQSVRKFFVGKYIAFYKADDKSKTIIILRFIYGGRDIDTKDIVD